MTSQIHHLKTLTLNPILWLRVATGVVGILMISLSLVGMALMYQRLHQVCTAPLQMCLMSFQLMPSNLAGIESPDWALHFHAIWRTVTQLVGRVPFWILAVLILSRRSRDVIGLITALWLLTYGAPFDLFTAAAAFPFLMPLVQFLFALGSLCFGLFLTLFPYGRFVPRWSIIVAALWLINAIANLFPSLSTATTQADQYRFLVINAIRYGSVVLLQMYRYRKLSNAIERQQTKWVVFGMVVWLILSLLTRWLVAQTYDPVAPITLMGYIVGIGFPLAALTLPASVAIAILRHHLFDIDLLINRTLVYSLLTATIVGLYALSVASLSTLFRADNSFFISLVGAGFIAVIFQPLRERLQRAINRLMYGQRDEPYAVLSQLGQRLTVTLTPHTVLPTIVETVARALKLPYVAIALGDAESHVLSAEYPHNSGLSAQHSLLIHIPLTYQAIPIGELRLAPRVPNEPFTPQDERLLNDLARQIGIAAHAVQLNADLQRSRERIVTTREEERRRLRRDLHDGLGPALAAQMLKVGAARALLARDPVTAERLLTELERDIDAAISDIRRLVYNLRPPALDELGLLGAIRATLPNHSETQTPHVTLTAPDTLPALSAAVEVAAYRIVQEALTNVLRHAHAQQCQITLTLSDQLHIIVEDDGVGLASAGHKGVGLTSMRERAAELGGTCVIENVSTGGTRIVAHLPISHSG